MPQSQSERLREILLKNLADDSRLTQETLKEIAEIEERYQFDDDRRAAQREIRDLIAATATQLRLSGDG
jgi:hypothetical protein